jgi:hypothetical protein
METSQLQHLLIFIPCAVAVFFLVLYFLPGMVLSVYRRAILKTGFGEGPVPVNTLYMQPVSKFANPMQASGSSLSTAGVNRDTLITIGWLDLRLGPLLLHVPGMGARYYSVQFTDSRRNTVFAYIGTRTTGSEAGDYLICGPTWQGAIPDGFEKIAAPCHAVLIIGRVLVYSESDLPAAYDLAKQIRLTAKERLRH